MNKWVKRIYAWVGPLYIIGSVFYIIYNHEDINAFFNFCTAAAFGFSMMVFSNSIECDKPSDKQFLTKEEINKISYIKYLYHESIIDDNDKNKMLGKCINKDK